LKTGRRTELSGILCPCVLAHDHEQGVLDNIEPTSIALSVGRSVVQCSFAPLGPDLDRIARASSWSVPAAECSPRRRSVELAMTHEVFHEQVGEAPA
jgi:hypothetical protein